MGFIQINENDNVIIALQDLSEGHIITIDEREIQLKGEIKRGHKIAVKPIEQNEDIIKYGSPIGHATQPIHVGEHVNTHNTKTNLNGALNNEFDQKIVEKK